MRVVLWPLLLVGVGFGQVISWTLSCRHDDAWVRKRSLMCGDMIAVRENISDQKKVRVCQKRN